MEVLLNEKEDNMDVNVYWLCDGVGCNNSNNTSDVRNN